MTITQTKADGPYWLVIVPGIVQTTDCPDAAMYLYRQWRLAGARPRLYLQHADGIYHRATAWPA